MGILWYFGKVDLANLACINYPGVHVAVYISMIFARWTPLIGWLYYPQLVDIAKHHSYIPHLISHRLLAHQLVPDWLVIVRFISPTSWLWPQHATHNNYTVTTFKYVEGGPDRKAPEVV